ncbi:hypothetical protein V1477_007975 [Vespula maculifrons]|uniref:Uncharacterized protein n=1 Tax=Vespula maculifrons TaxID=7453 RepID=A0ABD2CF67_VESMC
MDRRNAYRSMVIVPPLAITSNRDFQIGLRVPSNMWHSHQRVGGNDGGGGGDGGDGVGGYSNGGRSGIFTFWMNIRDTPLRDVLSSSHVVRGDASLKMRFHVVVCVYMMSHVLHRTIP